MIVVDVYSRFKRVADTKRMLLNEKQEFLKRHNATCYADLPTEKTKRLYKHMNKMRKHIQDSFDRIDQELKSLEQKLLQDPADDDNDFTIRF